MVQWLHIIDSCLAYPNLHVESHPMPECLTLRHYWEQNHQYDIRDTSILYRLSWLVPGL